MKTIIASGIVPKGKWYYPCCQRDLTQTEEDTPVEYIDAIEFFDTKNEALEDIIAMWNNSREINGNINIMVDEEIKECRAVMD